MIRPQRPALLAAAILAASIAPATAAAATDPAEQPPFDGAPVPELVVPERGDRPPPGFRLSPAEAIAIADRTGEVRGERAEHRLESEAGTRGRDRWEVTYVDAEGTKQALVVIDDRSGEVLEAWTDHQVEVALARGYEGAVAGPVSKVWIWLPLCALFLAPFVDRRRPFRLLHLDLLVLLAFSASLLFFNRGEIVVSVPIVYPVLGYLFLRMLLAGARRPGRREDRRPLVPHLPVALLAVACVLLVAFRVGLNIADSTQIDVGYAGVIGAERIAAGEDVYGEEFAGEEDIRGDVYGPANYLAYLPFEQLFPHDGSWEGTVVAQRAAAIFFDLATALGLLLVGFRLRAGREGRILGIALCYAWLAYPFTLYALNANTNDALVSMTLVATLLVFGSSLGRGAMTALGGLTKYGTLALAPLFAPGDGERRLRSTLIFALAFVAVAAAVTVPLIPDGGLREMYDRSIGYQAGRGSPFSVWGLAPALEPVQTAAKAFAVLLGLALFLWPRRRDLVQAAALGAAVLIALQVASEHWFYFYVLWFAPLVLVALFAVQRGPEPALANGGAPVRTRGAAR